MRVRAHSLKEQFHGQNNKAKESQTCEKKTHTNKQRDVQRAVASVTAAEWQRKQQLLRLLKRTAKECRQSVCRKRALWSKTHIQHTIDITEAMTTTTTKKREHKNLHASSTCHRFVFLRILPMDYPATVCLCVVTHNIALAISILLELLLWPSLFSLAITFDAFALSNKPHRAKNA